MSGLKIRRINRQLQPLSSDGGNPVANPAVNLHRCVQFSGNFEITAKIKLEAGSDSYLYFYGSPPMVQDEWRVDVNAINIEFTGGTVYWNTYDNSGVNIWGSVALAYGLEPTVTLKKSGPVTELAVNGTQVVLTQAVSYPDGRVYVGAREQSAEKSLTIETISTDATSIDTTAKTHPLTPHGLRKFAADNHPQLKIGAAVSAIQIAFDPQYGPTLAREFSEISIENALKFQYVQPTRGMFDFYESDYIVDFAEKNGMQLHGHAMAWEEAVPAWVLNGGFTKPELTTILQTHISRVIGRYAGKFRTWDIINEPFVEFTNTIRPSIWMSTIGRDYIKIALQAAATADPNLKLFINEWGCENSGAKQDALYALVQELQGQGVPIHGVGLQMHEDMNSPSQGNTNKAWTEPATLKAAIQRFQGLGIEVRVSELDLNLHNSVAGSEAARANYYSGWLNAAIETGIKSFCMWGFTDKWSSLQGWKDYRAYGNGMIFNSSYAKKAPYDSLKARLELAEGSTPPADTPVIGYYGDSTIYGTDGANDSQRVAVPAPERVAALTGWVVQNKGVGRTSLSDWINGNSAKGVFRTWTAEMAYNTAATHIIMNSAINDWAASEAEYKQRLDAIYAGVVGAGKTLILETPNPTYQTLWGGTTASDAQVAERSQRMRDWAALNGVRVIDQHQTLSDYFIQHGVTAAQFTPDGGHPTQAGYTRKGDYAATQLQAWNADGWTTVNPVITVVPVDPEPVDPSNAPAIMGPSNASNFALTFYDDFDGGSLSNKWNKGDVWSGGLHPNTMRVNGGELQMCVQPDTMFTGDNKYNYCIVDTNPKSGMGAAGGFEQKFGVFQIEAKMPVGRGIWPSFWLFNYFGNNRPEVDIFEAYPGGAYDWSNGSPPVSYRGDFSVHPMYSDDTYVSPGSNINAKLWSEFDASAGFHTYTFEWDTGYMKAYMDGLLKVHVTNSATLNYMNQFPLFIMLQLGINYRTAGGGPSSNQSVTPTGFGSNPASPPANVMRVKYCAAWQFNKNL